MKKERNPKNWNEVKTNDSWAIFKIMGEFVNGYEKLSKIENVNVLLNKLVRIDTIANVSNFSDRAASFSVLEIDFSRKLRCSLRLKWAIFFVYLKVPFRFPLLLFAEILIVVG